MQIWRICYATEDIINLSTPTMTDAIKPIVGVLRLIFSPSSSFFLIRHVCARCCMDEARAAG
jgi:hypothetical protein